MKSVAKLIHKTYMSYLPTAFPAHYYGMPDGKIYLVFSRFYEVDYGKTGLEFIFAEHKEFMYDYENDIIVNVDELTEKKPVFKETIDKPAPKIKIIKIKRNLNSYGEAHIHLNQEAQKRKKYA
ncbi:MAG: hypothetical protein ABFS16_11275 [Bacteroidota bacterium]